MHKSFRAMGESPVPIQIPFGFGADSVLPDVLVLS